MPFPQNHLLLAWQGTFVAGDTRFVPVDQFAGSLRLIGGGVAGGQTQQHLDGCVAALTAFWKRGDSFIPQRARINAIKLNLVDTAGRYVSKSETLETRDLDIAGTASMIHPLQIAWCTTWTTQQKRGLASKGRTFFPTGVEISSSQFLVSEANQTTMANSCTALIAAINAVFGSTADANIKAAVVSNQRDGASNVITGVQVGNRLDVQRRRAGSQDEEYVAKPVPVPTA